MFRVHTFVATTTLGLLLAGTAQALTADQVWARWQEAAAAAGLALSTEGSTTEGDALRLTAVTIRQAIPSGADDLEGSIAEVTMTNQADGSVTITMSPEFTVPWEAAGGGVTVSQQGFGLTARENGAAIAYDFAGDRVTANFAFAAPTDTTDEPAGPTSGAFGLVATGPNGSFSDTLDASRIVNLVLNAATLSYDVSTSDGAGMDSAQTTSLDDVAITMAADLPLTARLAELDSAGEFATLLKDGLSIQLDMTQGNASSSDKMTSDFMNYEMTSTSLPGSAKMTLDETGFGLIADGQGGSAAGTSDMLPVPINVGFGPIAMDFRMPIVGTEVQPFRYFVKVAGLTVNEEAWSLIDPNQSLPRDPANLEIDASGTASLDLLGLVEAEEAGMVQVAPPRIETLDIPKIALDLAGAAITGKGAFTFDNTGGVPVPLGTADITVTGINGLIDKLVTIGLLPEDQAGQARMMMGMFLKPGEGDDVLTSTIEAKEGGSLFVNGMQIQ